MSVAPVIRAAWVQRDIDGAFEVFTSEIGAWWPLRTHGLFGDRSGQVVFSDGQLIERAVDGSEAVWAHVTAWEPPHRFVLAWHPGRSLDEASEVAVTFEVAGERASDHPSTRVVIEHRGWERFGEDAANRRTGYVGPNAWGYVLDHFSSLGDIRPDAADVRALAAAYDDFFGEAGDRHFGDAPEGEWNAEQTLAHVALNDLAMLAVTQAIVHQQATRFENLTCHDLDALSRWIQNSGTIDGLIERGRVTARLVCAALRRLSPEQLDTMIHCRLLHDGEVMVDRPLPWSAVAVRTQAETHLPAHVEQLRNLRG